MALKVRKLAALLFNNDPLVVRILSLSSTSAKKLSALSHEESKKHPEDAENRKEPHNHFLKLVHHLQEHSDKFAEMTKKSLEWYKKKIGDQIEGELDPLQTYETQRTGVLSFAGQLIAFKYVPKNKMTLPYYDEYPLVLTLAVDGEGFLGLNFHYLRPIERAILMESLHKYESKRNFQRIIKIRYEQLLGKEQLKYFRPCIKRYLYKQMSPNMAIISPHLWDMSLFLPTEKWKSHTNKEAFTKRRVWQNSKKLIRKHKK